MREPRGTLFPVPVESTDDPRFAPTVKRVGRVMEEEGYPRIAGADRRDLAAKLMEFLYVSRGAAGELEQRLNGTAAPLVKAGGGLDSYDCLAVCHELRRVRGAAGALIIAMGADDQLSIGLAAEEGSMMDIVGNELIEALSTVIEKRGWKRPAVKDVGLEFVVPPEGGLKS